MTTKLLDTYKIYFLISISVGVVILLGNIGRGIIPLMLIFIAALLTPFIYELDYLLEAYIIDPESENSKNIKALIKQKNYRGAFIYAHENREIMDSTIFRSILMVISIFALAFLIVFSRVNIFANTLVLTFLLTTLYLETVSFFDGSWKTWYASFEFTPQEKYAKMFLGTQYLIYLIFLLQVI